MTDDLIGRLARDLRPVGARSVALRLGLALGVGGVVAVLGVRLLLGFRPDMPRAASEAPFWGKLAYTGAVTLLGMGCVERMSRPGAIVRRRLPWMATPLLLLCALAALQLLSAPPALRGPMIMGSSSSVCPASILLTSIPLFIALAWALKGLAPTRLRAAGALTGLTSGAAGASAYALHCTEGAAPFVAVWYTLGILAAAGAGALLGPRLLRW